MTGENFRRDESSNDSLQHDAQQVQADGELEQVGDRWCLRFVRHFAHTPEKVWRAITEPEHFDAWFPFFMEGELATGAKLRFRARDIETLVFDGEMLEFSPPTRMEVRWSENETLRFEVEPEGAGTRFTLSNVFDELGKAARNAAGWHSCIDALERDLDGAPAPAGSPAKRWERLNRAYVARFGPKASTVGPPAEHPYRARRLGEVVAGEEAQDQRRRVDLLRRVLQRAGLGVGAGPHVAAAFDRVQLDLGAGRAVRPGRTHDLGADAVRRCGRVAMVEPGPVAHVEQRAPHLARAATSPTAPFWYGTSGSAVPWNDEDRHRLLAAELEVDRDRLRSRRCVSGRAHE